MLPALRAWWAPALVFAFAVIGGAWLGVFDEMPWMDVPLHFAGGLAIAHFFDVALASAQGSTGRIHAVIKAATVIGLSAIAAILWEVAEYVADVNFGTRLILGVPDMLLDLCLGVLGACFLPANLLALLQLLKVRRATR